MRFRKLRIAFSATCLIACVLLIVLWVRDHRYYKASGGIRLGAIYITSYCMGITFAFGDLKDHPVHWLTRMDKNTTYWVGAWEVLDDKPHPLVAAQPPYRFAGGRWNCTNSLSIVAVPHLLLATIVAIVGSAPWIKQIPRFSLRTLLLATTLIALVLGLIVWSVR